MRKRPCLLENPRSPLVERASSRKPGSRELAEKEGNKKSGFRKIGCTFWGIPIIRIIIRTIACRGPY